MCCSLSEIKIGNKVISELILSWEKPYTQLQLQEDFWGTVCFHHLYLLLTTSPRRVLSQKKPACNASREFFTGFDLKLSAHFDLTRGKFWLMYHESNVALTQAKSSGQISGLSGVFSNQNCLKNHRAAWKLSISGTKRSCPRFKLAYLSQKFALTKIFGDFWSVVHG